MEERMDAGEQEDERTGREKEGKKERRKEGRDSEEERAKREGKRLNRRKAQAEREREIRQAGRLVLSCRPSLSIYSAVPPVIPVVLPYRASW
jgi:hypothetical protein